MKSYHYIDGSYVIIEDPLGNKNPFDLIRRGWAEHRPAMSASRETHAGQVTVYIADHATIPTRKTTDDFPFDFLVVIYAVSTYDHQTRNASVRIWFNELGSYMRFMKELRYVGN